MTNPIQPLLYSVADTCRLCSLGRTRVYELINSGTLKSTKIGRRTLISAESVRQLVSDGVS